MAMQICYPCGTGDCPPNVTAWGTYTVADNPPNGTCTLSRNGTQVQQVAVAFRPDGYWTAAFTAVPTNDGYACDAQYTPAMGAVVSASQESPVSVNNMAMPVPVPLGTGIPPSTVPPPPAGVLAAAAGAGMVVGVGGEPYHFKDSYDVFSGIHSLLTVVQNRATFKAQTALKQTLHFGHYTVLVPRPADISATNRYWVHCLFLNEFGAVVNHTTSNFPV